jgi:hypothetical protein
MHNAHVAPQRALADLVLHSSWDADPAHADGDAARIVEMLD